MYSPTRAEEVCEELTREAVALRSADYRIGRLLRAAQIHLETPALYSFVRETFAVTDKTIPSWISRRLALASLPEEAASLGIVKGTLLARASRSGSGVPFETLLHEVSTLSTEDFRKRRLASA